MNEHLIHTTDIPAPLISQLDSRDAALWLSGSEIDEGVLDDASRLMSLPWNIVLSEIGENGGAKLGHGSGGIILLRAA